MFLLEFKTYITNIVSKMHDNMIASFLLVGVKLYVCVSVCQAADTEDI